MEDESGGRGQADEKRGLPGRSCTPAGDRGDTPGDAARPRGQPGQVDRLLDPKSDVTLGSLQRAAAVVGCRVVIELA